LDNAGKYPPAFGRRIEGVWPEIWHIIKPLIDQVRGDGEATRSEYVLIPIPKMGKLKMSIGPSATVPRMAIKEM